MAFLQNYFHLNNAFRSLISRNSNASTASILSIDFELWTNQKRYAARKGKRIAATREKQKLARLRKEEMKAAPPKVWKPQKLSVDKNLNILSRKFSDADRKSLDDIVDNVFIMDQYKERKYPFEEAMVLIRETHHPELYDEPDALVEAKIELDLRTKRKTKFVERFQGIVSYPHLFKFGAKRKVIAICKSDEDQELAKKAGAELTGSSDIIRMLKVGDITLDNFDDLVCHGDMLIELASIKGLVGSYFPTKQRGNIGFDMDRLVRYFVNGIEYKLNKEVHEPDYGFVCVPFGRLLQTDEHLEENFETLLKIIDENRPPGAPGDFITRVLIFSEPSPEKISVAFWNNIEGYDDPTINDEEIKNNDAEQKTKPEKQSQKL